MLFPIPMSSFITSLLIEPVFRQARRLSRQTSCQSSSSSSLSNSPGESLSNLHSQRLSAGRNGDKAMVTSDQGSSVGSSGSANSPSIVPTPASEEMSSRDGAEIPPRERQHREYALNRSSTEAFNARRSEESARVVGSPTGSTNTRVIRLADISIPPRESSPDTLNTQQTERLPRNSFGMDDTGQSLPEDDGMGVLRRKIHTIRAKNISSTEKARMVHELMTEDYNFSRGRTEARPLSAVFSPSSPQSRAPSKSPTSYGSELFFEQQSTASTASITQPTNPFNLTPEDLKPTFAPRDEPDSPLGDEDDLDTEELEESCLGCPHYKRNIKPQCFTCKKWYTCRFCHDEFEDHPLIRQKTEHMLCMICGHAQAASQWCKQCGEPAAQYYCNVCKLWDNDSNKSIYHCPDCGICRIGQGLGKDFFHCKTCSVCLPISIENTHRCIERSTQCDCPICGDYMFTSPETVVVMRCGHSIHHKCLSEHSRSSYRCPLCSKTITNMESTFRNLDRAIESQPMPTEFRDARALIYCNDCGAKSIVKYHWLGLKCDLCDSYNTAQIRLLRNDALDSVRDADSGNIPGSRFRPSSYGAGDETLSPTLESLQISVSSVPGTSLYSRLSAPSSEETNARSSYNLSRGRTVSPVVSNYFGLPPSQDEASQSKSTSVFGKPNKKDDKAGNSDILYFWGEKLKRTYALLGDTEPVEGPSKKNIDDDEEEDGGELTGNDEVEGEEEEEEVSEDEEEEYVDDEDEDEVDDIDVFGHR